MNKPGFFINEKGPNVNIKGHKYDLQYTNIDNCEPDKRLSLILPHSLTLSNN